MDDKLKKGKKVGADGLTKKERRALKVGTEKSVDTTNTKIKSVVNNPVPEQPSIPLNIAASVIGPITPNFHKSTLQNDTGSVKSQIHNVSKNEISKNVLILQPQDAAAHLQNFNKENIESDKKKSQFSKAELKAQRRAVQEAQRLSKGNEKVTTIKTQPIEKPEEQKVTKKTSPKKELVIKTQAKHKVQLFNHLYLEDSTLINLKNYSLNKDGVHSAFLKLGAQYLSKSILGSNARCLAMLSALKCLISDFTTPPKQEFCRSLETTLQLCVAHLNNCRPLAVSMTNALRQIKILLTQTNTHFSDDGKRNLLQERVDRYIQDDIGKAGEAISDTVNKKISDGDIILTYGYSSLIKKILVDSHNAGKQFKVIVLDSRPLLEGKEMLRRLVCANIQCSYLLINAASFVMNRVTKVLLGAHALLANGYVMSRTGTAQVALVANAYNKPVLVCCEMYKFCERAQTDSFVYNEIGDQDKLTTIGTSNESSLLHSNYLTPLTLMYDVTPSDLVTAVVTEIAILPCTSVPVILRIRPVE